MPPRHTPASLSLPLSLRLCPFTNPFSLFSLPRCTPPSSCPCPQNRPPGDRYYCYRYRSKASWKRGCLRFPFTLPLRPITSDHDTDGFTSLAGEKGEEEEVVVSVSVSRKRNMHGIGSFVPGFSFPLVFFVRDHRPSHRFSNFPPSFFFLSFSLSLSLVSFSIVHVHGYTRGGEGALLNTETATIAFLFFH